MNFNRILIALFTIFLVITGCDKENVTDSISSETIDKPDNLIITESTFNTVTIEWISTDGAVEFYEVYSNYNSDFADVLVKVIPGDQNTCSIAISAGQRSNLVIRVRAYRNKSFSDYTKTIRNSKDGVVVYDQLEMLNSEIPKLKWSYDKECDGFRVYVKQNYGDATLLTELNESDREYILPEVDVRNNYLFYVVPFDQYSEGPKTKGVLFEYKLNSGSNTVSSYILKKGLYTAGLATNDTYVLGGIDFLAIFLRGGLISRLYSLAETELDTVQMIASNKGGDLFAVAGAPSEYISVYKFENETPEYFLKDVHTAKINSLAISEDEKFLYSMDETGKLVCWDLNSRATKFVVNLPYTLSSMTIFDAETIILTAKEVNILKVSRLDGSIIKTINSDRAVLHNVRVDAVNNIYCTRSFNTFDFYKADNDLLIKTWVNYGSGTAYDFILDGYFLINSGDQKSYIINTETWQQTEIYKQSSAGSFMLGDRERYNAITVNRIGAVNIYEPIFEWVINFQ